ncbi:porin [Arhodomonas sp. AD133]|uniref:porin n=1 Tax=Arhodomonas sp. AD133 TaxID=3415009 RepID=UPI003EC105CB
MRYRTIAVLTAASALCIGSGTASAIELTQGDWRLNINGNVNVHAINNSCGDSGDATVLGGVTCPLFGDEDNLGGGDDRVSGVSTGLLPAALVFNLGTTQKDWNGRPWDLNAVFGFYPGVVSNSDPNLDPGQTQGLQSASIDTRQVYLQFANDDFGTVKMGRDFGLFGYDAIINDMTLPGVGVQGFQAPTPNNTTLGSIGYGYLYTDTLSQITYITPSFSGFTVKAGIYQPLDAVNFSTLSAESVASKKSQPGFHGSVRYDIDAAGVTGFVSMNGITQEHTGLSGTRNRDGDSWGVDFNAMINVADFSVLGSYYTAEGMGNTALFFDAFDAMGEARDSDGMLLQGTYAIGRTKLGVNYGVSRLDANPGDPGTLVAESRKYTVGVYHDFTDNLTFLAEYSDATSENQAGDDYASSNINVGAFLSF